MTLVPQHWLRRAHDAVDFQLSRLGGAAAAAALCSLNGRSFDNALDAGAYLCRAARSPAQQMALSGAFHGIEAEQVGPILEAMIQEDEDRMMVLVSR